MVLIREFHDKLHLVFLQVLIPVHTVMNNATVTPASTPQGSSSSTGTVSTESSTAVNKPRKTGSMALFFRKVNTQTLEQSIIITLFDLKNPFQLFFSI